MNEHIIDMKNMTYKDIVSSTPEIKEIINTDVEYTYSDIISSCENRDIYENKIDDNTGEFIYGMMDKIDSIKTKLHDQGYMNTFSYNDTYEIINKCITIENLPELLSDEEESDNEEEYIGI